MRIAIDISPIIYGTGVSVYTRNLVENLLKIDSKNEYVLFGGSLRRFNELKSILHNYHATAYPIPPLLADFVWNRLHVFPIEKLIGKVDVFHSSDWVQPPSKAFKVTTIHDLTPILFPELTHPKIVATHKRRLKWVFKEADRVIVPSQTTKNDLVKLGYGENKVRVIAEAVDPSFTRVNSNVIESVKQKYQIHGRYLLSVGVNERKNTKRIIEAYKKLKRNLNVTLAIIGHSQELTEAVKGVVFTGHVPQSDMQALFSGAEVLVYPSLYEGFGLPILEAYTCQVPVVTSDLGSMKEIGGAGSVLVNPNRVDDIARGIKRAIKDRARLVINALGELKKYSWQQSARETLEIYKESST